MGGVLQEERAGVSPFSLSQLSTMVMKSLSYDGDWSLLYCETTAPMGEIQGAVNLP